MNEETAISRQHKAVPGWLLDTLKDSTQAEPFAAHTTATSHQMQGNLVATACNEEPLCHKDAFDSKYWVDATQSELDSIRHNGTWAGRHIIGSKWVCKLKRKADGNVDCYKPHLVAKSYAL